MKWLDLTLRSPAENLACDEALLDLCEAGAEEEVLRVWESPEPFVVVGYGNRVAEEVNVSSCAKAELPILRRCSGGGTVVQGPGCLNYSLVLRIDESGPTGSIAGTNAYVMQKNRAALQLLLTERIEIRGYTDLAVNEWKFSGNAQRRRRRCLLFHGSFLLRFDLNLIEEVLLLPSRQPEYRQSRPHRNFLRNIGLPKQTVANALRQTWQAARPLERAPDDAIAQLVHEKYGDPRWNRKF
jgi:lipoate-protein ligase A